MVASARKNQGTPLARLSLPAYTSRTGSGAGLGVRENKGVVVPGTDNGHVFQRQPVKPHDVCLLGRAQCHDGIHAPTATQDHFLQVRAILELPQIRPVAGCHHGNFREKPPDQRLTIHRWWL